MKLLPSVPPDQYASAFRALKNVDDLARVLGVSPDRLARCAYGAGRAYRQTRVRKRRGGTRTISQPAAPLKILQLKLSTLLTAAYPCRPCVHGFVPGKSIATNAAVHAGRRWVFNLDLKDFFPSINFGRIRGRLMARPFSLPAPVATVCAQLCSYHDELPQGAPSSPVLSNIVSSKLDADLQRLASRSGCQYTRYADDLTFSTDDLVFPATLGRRLLATTPGAEVGDVLRALIEDNGFTVNHLKVRLQRFDARQEVTGLVVNTFPNVRRAYVRKVRAMLRAWRVFGYEAAEAEWRKHYDTKHRPFADAPFRDVVKGHIDFIAMVRGNTDPIYEDLIRQLAELDPAFRIRPRKSRKRDHLPRFDDAVWVLEWEWGQGTAFELQDIGLVTCAHVLRMEDDGRVIEATDIDAWQLRDPETRVRAVLREKDVDADLAILDLDKPSGRPLVEYTGPPLPIGSPVHAAGFPNQSPGAGLWRDQGNITRLDHHVGSPRYTVSFTIVSGASGSPVLDSANRVVGIASMGADSFEAAAMGRGVRFGVIPVDLLRTFAGGSS